MRIGVPLEAADQPLVAATPQTVGKLASLGYEVSVQRGAGAASHFPDIAYEQAGAVLVDEAGAWDADVVLSVDSPSSEHLARMKRGATYVGRLAPARSPELLEDLRSAGVTALALDIVPRISRAQAMDVLSSQANIAGYRAVIEAATHFGRIFNGQVTAAGKFPPARVYVIGAGVAGLAAIGTAYSIGAEVSGTDVRPEVADQVKSMGATFVPLPTADEAEVSTDGYAKEMTQDAAALANKLYAEQAAKSDIVITTANIPGRTSPMLLDRAAIEAMKPGSVIVDMAAANGGNTELTVAGETVVTANGVTIIGYTDLATRMPSQASQVYSQNVVNLLTLMTPEKDGSLALNFDDEVVRGVTVTHEDAIMWPPPPIKVSAAPVKPQPAEPSPEEIAAAAAAKVAQKAAARRKRFMGFGAAALLLIALVLATPAIATQHYIVLLLAVVLGFYVISNVTPALHTPLMSVTNAISGIILVGAISQIGNSSPVIAGISFVAIVLSSINIFGGFAVTHRMLAMFQK